MSNYTLKQLETISSLIQRDTVIFLTAANWGRLAAELPTDTFTTQGHRATPQNFKRLALRAKHVLTATNSGSDDEAALDLLNRIAETQSGFRWAKEKFAVPKGSKRDALEYVDAESTHELPIDLMKEKIRREEIRRSKL